MNPVQVAGVSSKVSSIGHTGPPKVHSVSRGVMLAQARFIIAVDDHTRCARALDGPIVAGTKCKGVAISNIANNTRTLAGVIVVTKRMRLS